MRMKRKKKTRKKNKVTAEGGATVLWGCAVVKRKRIRPQTGDKAFGLV